VRNKIKHRKKYKIGKSLTPLGKITINVFYKYIINATTTVINTCKKLFEIDQREVISFFEGERNQMMIWGFTELLLF
jgi:hypothetical protein